MLCCGMSHIHIPNFSSMLQHLLNGNVLVRVHGYHAPVADVICLSCMRMLWRLATEY
jgi:hypothetical protein